MGLGRTVGIAIAATAAAALGAISCGQRSAVPAPRHNLLFISLDTARQDVLGSYEVPRGNLRLQLEQELREKLITLRQAYLANARHPEVLEGVLKAAASSFVTLCRSLLRLRGESPPAHAAQAIERVADVFGLEAEGLLGAHLVRHGERHHKGADLLNHYRKFLVEVERLVNAIDEMRVP